MSKKIALFIIKYRIPLLIIIAVLTGFFAFQMYDIRLSTDFGDLLPKNHPYIKMHNEFRKTFGGANLIFIELSVKEGDIYSFETLNKILKISDELMFIKGVNRESVFSIASQKAKDFKIDAYGFETRCLMWPEAPKTKEEIDHLKSVIFSNDIYYGPLVSLDSKSALITADLNEWDIDYEFIYQEILKLCGSVMDSNTEIYMSGTPILYGFLYVNLNKIISILGITLLVMLALLFSYSRKFVEMVLPLISCFICAIWGLGFTSLIGYNLDPLIIVVPILISTRIISHSVQLIERYFEEYKRFGAVKSGVQASIEGLFFPGLAGIITDAAGILIIAIIPIPLLQKLGIICFFWAMFSTFIVLVLNPVLLLFCPAPRQSPQKESGRSGIENVLYKLGSFNVKGVNNWIVVSIAIIITICAVLVSQRLVIGETRLGTPILWPDSKYNQDTAHLNEKFKGCNPLLIAIEGEQDHAIKNPELMQVMDKFQRWIEKDPNVGGSVSVMDIVRRVYMQIHEGDPKWDILPRDAPSIGTMMFMFLGSGNPRDFDKYADGNYQKASLTIYYKNKTGTTVSNAIEKIKNFFESNPVEGIKFRLGGGVIGVMAAMNETIFNFQVQLLLYALLIVGAFCSLFLRSWLAGILLIASLTIANFMVFAYMVMAGIGLDINTLPVASIAIGIGVDYGIYLFGRMREEYIKSNDLNTSIITSIVTTGKAITFTAITIVAGVFVWYFSYIRFQADMGLLMAIVTVFHLLGTLLLLPALVAIIKPKFICGN